MENLGSQWTDFRDILYLSVFLKSPEKIHVPPKFDKKNGYCTWSLLLIYLSEFSLKWKKFQRDVSEMEKHTFCRVTIFLKSGQLRDNVEKYCRGRQVAVLNRIRRTHIVWGMNKVTDTHSEYVIFNLLAPELFFLNFSTSCI